MFPSKRCTVGVWPSAHASERFDPAALRRSGLLISLIRRDATITLSPATFLHSPGQAALM